MPMRDDNSRACTMRIPCPKHVQRESPNESRVCESKALPEQLETFLRKNLDEHRALCANLASPADGYVPAALSRAKG